MFNRLEVSGIMGSISLACWIIVFTPQIYENHKRKSSQGLSLAFVFIWLLGDIFNVLGSICQHVLPTMILLAVYYTLADLLLLYQCIVYKGMQPLEQTPLLGEPVNKPNKVLKNVLIVFMVVFCGFIGFFLSPHKQVDNEPVKFSILGQILGWICAVLYLASRIPQLLLNYKRKSTDGVAVLFFIFTLLGNITYCLSIFAADSSWHAIAVNASWILGALGSLMLDLAVLVQFYMYQ